MGRCASKFYVDKTRGKANGYYNFEGGVGVSSCPSGISLINLNSGIGSGGRRLNPYRNRVINDPEHKMLSYNGFSNLPVSILLGSKLRGKPKKKGSSRYISKFK